MHASPELPEPRGRAGKPQKAATLWGLQSERICESGWAIGSIEVEVGITGLDPIRSSATNRPKVEP